MRNLLAPLLIIFLIASMPLFAQTELNGYTLFTTIERPDDIEAIPFEFMMDSTLGYLLIAYDFNPTQIDIHDLKTFHKLGRVEISGYAYFDNSYFDKKRPIAYVDHGKDENKYVKLNLRNFSMEKVDCILVPKGCAYDKVNPVEYAEYKDGAKIKNKGAYVIIYNENKVMLYLKKK